MAQLKDCNGVDVAVRDEQLQGREGWLAGNLAMVPNQEGESPSRKRSSQPTCIHDEECNTSYEVTRNPFGNRKSRHGNSTSKGGGEARSGEEDAR